MKKFTRNILLVLSTIIMAFGAQAQTVLLSENFDNTTAGTTPPNGWTRSQDTPSVGWGFNTVANLSSSYFNIPTHNSKIACTNDDKYDDNTQVKNMADRDMLISPSIDLTGRTACLLTFDAYYEGHAGYEQATVEVSTDSGSTWSTAYTLTGATAWQTVNVDLSLYVGNTINVAFKYNDQNTWAFGFAIDNVVVKEPAPVQVALTALTMDQFVPVTVSPIKTTPVKGTLTNYGASPLTSVVVNWTVDGGALHTETVTGLNIPTGGTGNFATTATIPLATPVAYNVNVNVSYPNGVVDSDTSDNYQSMTINGITGLVAKNVVVEEATGAWCGWCPEGALILDTMKAHYTNLIPVSIHGKTNGGADNMEITDGRTIINQYISGFPGGMVDRVKYNGTVEQNRGDWEPLLQERSRDVVPASVGLYATYDSATRTITAKVYSRFYGAANGQYRMNVYVCENDVVGSGNGYDQHNYDAGTSTPVLGSLPSVISGWHHQQVLRAMLGGPWGTTGIIPTVVNAGDTFVKQYTYVLPAGYNAENLFMVGMVQAYNADATNRPIINATKSGFNMYNQTSVASSYYTTDTASTTGNGPLVFHAGDTLNTGTGTIIFQIGDTVTINGVTIVISNFGDSVVINTGDSVDVSGPIGAGSFSIPSGQHYYHNSTGTVTFYDSTTTVGVGIVKAGENFTVYPNPTSNVLNLNMLIGQQGALQVALLNISGQKVYGFESANYAGGPSSMQISTAELPAGVYILSITTAQSRMSTKVVIAR